MSLTAMERLKEAIEPTMAGLEIAKTKQAARAAAIATRNLSELYLAMGDLSEALKLARRCDDLAEGGKGVASHEPM